MFLSDMNLSKNEITQIVIRSGAAIIGCFLNSALIFVIVYHTPKSWKTYSILLLAMASIDFSASLSALWSQTRIIPYKLGSLFISNAPCQLAGPTSCFVGFVLCLLYM